MHILFIHQAFTALDEAGGTRHYELARCLVERGHRVTIIASPVSYLTGKTRQGGMKWMDRQEPEPGITILRTYTYSALHKSFVHRVFSFLSFMLSSFLVGIQVKEVDLVWGTSPPIFQGMTAWLLARLKRGPLQGRNRKSLPFLFEVRDLWPAFAMAVGVLRNPILIRASLWLERFLYRHADRVMVNSPGFIEHVTARGAARVELVANGAAPEMFDPQADGQAFRSQHGLDGKFCVMYAGAHGMSNDLGVVLQAADRLRDCPQVQFVFVGDGKEKAHLATQAERMDLTNVLFLPPVPKEQMNQVLAASSACIAILLPLELYKTTYPNKVFDYMAAGRPVILAIDGVIRMLVEASNAGIFVPPGDPQAMAETIRTLANNPTQVTEMGLSGRQYIETHFNRQILAEKLARLLEEMRGAHG
jgi:glycosyltransferase involved in cell wall biosynthesis